MEVKSAEQWAEPLKDFGEDKHAHFMASYLAMSDLGHPLEDDPIKRIGYCFSKALETGLDKELADKGVYDSMNSHIVTQQMLEAFEAFSEIVRKYDLDVGDILGNLSGLGYGLNQKAIGELVHMQNKGEI